jgi:hypothetical protein
MLLLLMFSPNLHCILSRVRLSLNSLEQPSFIQVEIKMCQVGGGERVKGKPNKYKIEMFIPPPTNTTVVTYSHFSFHLLYAYFRHTHRKRERDEKTF